MGFRCSLTLPATATRGRALILDKIRMDEKWLSNADYVKTLYDAELSAACRQHCVNHYDETGLILAARRDVVAAGLVPESVKAFAEKLKKSNSRSKAKEIFFITSMNTLSVRVISSMLSRPSPERYIDNKQSPDWWNVIEYKHFTNTGDCNGTSYHRTDGKQPKE